jgi:hypothetical protein
LQRSDRCGQKSGFDRTGKVKKEIEIEGTRESNVVFIAECGPCAGAT